jgi:hypothetical protein
MNGQWTIEQANGWRAKQKWGAGCNFYPSNAINQLEMWQEETFSPELIDHEMGLMEDIGMSIARIYLHDLVYEADPAGFKARMDKVLSIASSHGIRVLYTFFDDCWYPEPKLGKQPEPRPSMHNSGWQRSPADSQRNWPQDYARLKVYVQDVLTTFANDSRVWMWDLYNEPGNSDYGMKSLPLLREVFDWAREVRPSQPLTSAAFIGGLEELDPIALELSDVVTFHDYSELDETKKVLERMRKVGRPVVISEWMARTNGSKVVTHLPFFKDENVPCVQWGFIWGKTQTIWPWGTPEGAPEPELWFHDLLRPDGSPFQVEEVEMYKQLCKSRL